MGDTTQDSQPRLEERLARLEETLAALIDNLAANNTSIADALEEIVSSGGHDLVRSKRAVDGLRKVLCDRSPPKCIPKDKDKDDDKGDDKDEGRDERK